MHFPLRCLLGLGFLCITSGLFAHQDTILPLENGKIGRLPEKYQPATFDQEKGILKIGSRTTTLPPFLQNLFPENGEYDLQISGSWYHEPEIMPYYISFHITPKGRDFSYQFLLNLDTLEMMDAYVELRESEKLTRTLKIMPDGGGVTEVIYEGPLPIPSPTKP